MSSERKKEILREVRKVEIKARRITDQFFAGEYRSAFKGTGLSFAEVRPYQYGDEVRNIDWKVTARTGNPYIKVFEEEREASVIIVLDSSASMFYGSGKKDKYRYAVELAATIAYSAISANDMVSLVVFNAAGHQLIPPGKGRPQLFKMISKMVEAGKPEAGTTPLAEVLEKLAGMRLRSNVCFIISDFQTTDYQKPLKLLGLKYDLTGMYIQDPAESKLPLKGKIFARDLETGAPLVIDSHGKDGPGLNLNDAMVDMHQNIFNSAGAGFLRFNTNSSFVPVLLEFYQRRMR